ncbi:MAG: isoleucine--tRNA ligase, partial [bacterium]
RFWQENKLLEKCMEQNRGKKRFVFYEGPPTANGLPHVGHVQGRALKDIFLRYRQMLGCDVLRKAGWDTHGLPVEIEVEKELGLECKEQIEEYGIEKFIKKCRESVFRYEGEWRRMTERVGCWLDVDDPYITCTNNYIESVWWILKQYREKGLLYKGHKIVPYCCRCGTALSSHEVAQGYEEVEDPSVFVRFGKVDEPGTSFLVWTTTPWTLISNVAIAVGEGIDYVKVKYGDEYFILAEGCLSKIFKEGEVEVVETFKGAVLKDADYEPPFKFMKSDRRGHYAITADFVSLDEGTGIVHIAPAFGEDDYRVGEEYGLPFFQPVDEKGRFTDEVTDWKGVFVKDADPSINENMRGRGILLREEKYTHSYPFCWRCKLPLLYYARSSWFLKTTAYRDTLLRVNDEIKWIPDHIRTGRMGDFLVNNIDWAISRERYWGTPLPLWICGECEETLIVDSAAELKEHAIEFPDGELDLHKPYIDEIKCKCPKCGGTMARTPEVIDCWFDSGAMTVAQWHYPHENVEFFKEVFPADYITEAIDQTRGWFYSLMAISAFLFEKSCFKTCLVQGHVTDREGIKMSKSKDNVIDPWDAFAQFGADTFRWYFFRENNPWINTRFFMEALMEEQKNFFLTLWNVYSFFVIYANIDGFDPKQHKIDIKDRDHVDRWVLSRLHGLIETVDGYLQEYAATPAARAIEAFLDELSNWYVRRCRPRFWKANRDDDKWAAYVTLYEVLETLARLMAPFTPFVSEALYQNLVRGGDPDAPISIHLASYPAADGALRRTAPRETGLEEAMERVRSITTEGRSLRAASGIRVRQPLPALHVKVPEGAARDNLTPLLPYIKDEINVLDVVFVDSLAELETVQLKPDFKKLGPKFGKDANKAAAAIKECAGEAVWKQLEADGKATVGSFEIEKDDVVAERVAKEGFAIGEAVALDLRVSEELRRAGLAREIIHHVQNLRKEMDLEYTDRIVLRIGGGEDLMEVAKEHADRIKAETLAVELKTDLSEGEGREVSFAGTPGRIDIRKSA